MTEFEAFAAMQTSQTPPRANLAGWLYVSPLVLVLVPFFVAPILVVLAASFFATDGFGGLTPGFTLASYVEVLHSALTLKLYLATIKFTVLTWVFTLIIGFFVAYFLVFHVRNQLLAIGLFLLCTVPFWTSNIIRMISWIPLLGKRIKKLDADLAFYRDPNRPIELPATIKGKVLASDPKWHFVVINVGEEQGVLEHGELLVNRDGKLVAKVIVSSVEKNRCVANIMTGWELGEVFEGDMVTPAHPKS
jgi:hypothetical protein